MNRTFLLAGLILFSTSAYCDGLVFHLQSHHREGNNGESRDTIDENGNSVHESRAGMNNDNFGLAYKTDSGYTLGLYRNSFYKPTWYTGKEFMYNRYIGGFMGLATGYQGGSGKKFLPFVAATVKIPVDDKYGIVFNVIPTKDFKDYVVINMALERKF